MIRPPPAATLFPNTTLFPAGGSPGANASDSTTIGSAAQPSLKIVASHTGNFSQGQQGAAYSLLVTYEDHTSTLQSHSDIVCLPSLQKLVSMSGTGWSCPANSCTRSDAL